MEGFCVEPGPECAPALRLVMVVARVWCAKDERIYASYGGKTRDATYGVIEAQRINEITEHSRVYNSCNTCTACDIAHGQTSSFREPCCSDCRNVSEESAMLESSLSTLRAGNEESAHAQADDETLCCPNRAKTANSRNIVGVHDRENE